MVLTRKRERDERDRDAPPTPHPLIVTHIHMKLVEEKRMRLIVVGQTENGCHTYAYIRNGKNKTQDKRAMIEKLMLYIR